MTEPITSTPVITIPCPASELRDVLCKHCDRDKSWDHEVNIEVLDLENHVIGLVLRGRRVEPSKPGLLRRIVEFFYKQCAESNPHLLIL